MSAEATIFSSFKPPVTVERPLTASAITTTPKPIKIAPETKPPILSALAIVVSSLPRAIMNHPGEIG